MLYSPRKLSLACALSLLLLQTNALAHDTTYPSVDCEHEYLAPPKVTSFVEAYKNSSNPLLQKIHALLSSRSIEQQYAIDQNLTQLHAERGMSFQVKNPDTGFYDKTVAVSITGVPAVISESDTNGLIQSAGPMMRMSRSLLQDIYSAPELTVESLRLQDMPADEAALMLRVIRSSPYLEPKLRAAVMKDYPFLSIAGFDGSIGDPLRMVHEFFEINLGTPSGLANNFMVQDEFKTADPELMKILGPFIPNDSTFRKLRWAIDSNAHVWTGRKGLTVAISPGPYAGAHPDVVMIAKMAGFPLVQCQDLYQGKDGWVRLDIGAGENDPIVTGVYGRMDESYFFQNSAEGIPAINPLFKNNAKLQEELGVKLRPFVAYDFIYNDKMEIIGVNKDENGQPKLMQVWDTIKKGSFRDALLSRKLYYSGLGGRVLDDKRLLRPLAHFLVKDTVAKDLARPIKTLNLSEYHKFYQRAKIFVGKEPANSGGAGIVFPENESEEATAAYIDQVKADPGEYVIQYRADTVSVPRITQSKDGTLKRFEANMGIRFYLVMDGYGSVDGGVNSVLGRTSPENDFRDNTSIGGGYAGVFVVADHPVNGQKEKPIDDRYALAIASADRTAALALQQITDLEVQIEKLKDAKVTSESQNLARDLSYNLRGLMADLPESYVPTIARLLDLASGHPSEPLHHLAMQLAQIKMHIVSSWKIRRGGEVEKFIHANDFGTKQSLLSPNNDHVAAVALDQILHLENDIFVTEKTGQVSPAAQDRARSLSMNLREIIYALDGKSYPTISLLLDYASGNLAHPFETLKLQLDEIKKHLATPYRLRKGGELEKFANDHKVWLSQTTVDPLALQESQLPTKAVLRRLLPREITNRFPDDEDNGTTNWKEEVAEYMSVDDLVVQNILDQIHSMGGQLRLLREFAYSFRDDQTAVRHSWEPAYFWLSFHDPIENDFYYHSAPYTPYIAIDLTQSYALSILVHELEHFKMWKEHYDRLKATTNLTHREICRELAKIVITPEYVFEGETRALNAEMETEVRHASNPYMRILGRRKPRVYYEQDYINRIAYPAFEAFLRVVINGNDTQDLKARFYMRKMVDLAFENRNKAIEYYASRGKEDPVAKGLASSTLYDLLVFPFGTERLKKGESLEKFQTILLQICDEKKIDRELCLKSQLELPFDPPLAR